MWSRAAATKRLRPQVMRLAARSMATTTSVSCGTNSDNCNHVFLAAAAVGVAFGLAMTADNQIKISQLESRKPHRLQQQSGDLTPAERGDHLKPEYNHPPPRAELPTYTMEEVSEHADEDSLWYTFRGGVYDLTFFAQGHPGGFPVSIA
jgi:hypothetical protein